MKTGDWVMIGGAHIWNYVLSGKWQPGFTNRFARPGSGEAYVVPQASLKWPRGLLGAIKGFMGQRVYVGPELPSPVK